MASQEKFEDWKSDIEQRAQESVENSSSKSVMNELSKTSEEAAVEKRRSFVEGGGVFENEKEARPFLEHRGAKTFIGGKEAPIYSEIDSTDFINLDLPPEEIADRFITDAKRGYKGEFYICRTEDGGLSLQLVQPRDGEVEWYPGNSPISRQLLTEHYKEVKDRQRREAQKSGIGTSSEDKGRLNEDDALAEANAMRVAAGAQTWNKGQRFNHETRRSEPIGAEEYQKAFEVIRELEGTINDQVGAKKILSKLGYGSLAATGALLAAVSPFSNKTSSETFHNLMSLETLNAAKRKLENMKKRGETWAKIRSNYY